MTRHNHQHQDLMALIAKTIKEAEEQGADWLEQNRRAMNAVLEKYPYTSQIDAARLISKLNR